jgi:hypothetical protein
VEINCLACDQPVRSRDGRFILKHFLLDGPRRKAPSRAKNGTLIRTPTNTLS